MVKVNSMWTRSVSNDPEKKESLTKTVLNSSYILTILRTILEDEEIRIYNEEANLSEDQYESGSWSHLQAHRNGLKEAYRKIKKLTDHLVKE